MVNCGLVPFHVFLLNESRNQSNELQLPSAPNGLSQPGTGLKGRFVWHITETRQRSAPTFRLRKRIGIEQTTDFLHVDRIRGNWAPIGASASISR